MIDAGSWMLEVLIHHPTSNTQQINYETVTIFTQKRIPTNFSE